jgi:hypothetical protein
VCGTTVWHNCVALCGVTCGFAEHHLQVVVEARVLVEISHEIGLTVFGIEQRKRPVRVGSSMGRRISGTRVVGRRESMSGVVTSGWVSS